MLSNFYQDIHLFRYDETLGIVYNLLVDIRPLAKVFFLSAQSKVWRYTTKTCLRRLNIAVLVLMDYSWAARIYARDLLLS
ncbi:DUF6888 family protein [Merismopedia glauca]|uniref:DUF6888 family protein n=1 Tax=Merismopedia glauca TaxID=292586 RepID=UPI003BB4FE15